jgi:transcriptional regulator with XRE-family HTH domain
MKRPPRAAVPLDVRALTGQIVRALRGRRSQRALSVRLGYRVNVLSGWESGRRAPPAHEVLRMAERVGRDVSQALAAFDARLATGVDPSTEAGVGAIVTALIGERTHAEIARALGESRSTVARWAQAKVAPRFSDLLRLVGECTHRTVDFVGCFADPSSIDAVAREHARIEAQRLLLREDPALAAVLPALTLRAYRRLARHREGWVAARVGITRQQELRGLALLEAAGVVRLRRGKYEVVHDRRVDVRADRDAVVRLQQHWAHVAAERAGKIEGDLTRFHLVSVATEDLEALRALLGQLFETVDGRLAAVRDPEHVVLIGVLLQKLSP